MGGGGVYILVSLFAREFLHATKKFPTTQTRTTQQQQQHNNNLRENEASECNGSLSSSKPQRRRKGRVENGGGEGGASGFVGGRERWNGCKGQARGRDGGGGERRRGGGKARGILSATNFGTISLQGATTGALWYFLFFWFFFWFFFGFVLCTKMYGIECMGEFFLFV